MVRLFRVDGEKLVHVPAEALEDRTERELERLVISQATVFGEELLFIGEQSNFPDIGGDAIDILALDKEGNVVVIELKRGTTPSDIDFQVLKYVAYVSGLTLEDLAAKASEFYGQPANQE